MVKETLVVLAIVPTTAILWNQPKLMEHWWWKYLRILPLITFFLSLFCVSFIIPPEVSDHVRRITYRHLVMIWAVSNICVVAVYGVVLYRAEYSEGGLKKLGSDFTKSVFDRNDRT